MRDEYEIVVNEVGFRSLQAEWDVLHAHSTEQRYSQSFAWCWTTWEEVEKPRGRRLFCLVARCDGRIVLIWPYVIFQDFFWRVAAPLGGAYMEYTFALVADDPAADERMAEAWRMLRQRCGCDVIHLPCVRAGSTLHRMMSAENAARVGEVTPTSSVEWAAYPAWENYFGSLKADDRRELARRRRRLDQLGTVKFEAVVGGPRSVEIIDWVLRNKVAQRARAGEHGLWLETDAYRKLLTLGAMRGGAPGNMIGFALTLDGAIIAARMARVDSRRVESITTVFDPSFAKYGPGQILTLECLKWACESRLDFDMRVGDYAWKQTWANCNCDVISYDVGNSWWAMGYSLYWRLRHWSSRVRSLASVFAKKLSSQTDGRGRHLSASGSST